MEKAREETDEGCRSQPNWPKFVISVGKKMKNMNQEEENQMKGRLFRLKMKILNTRKCPLCGYFLGAIRTKLFGKKAQGNFYLHQYFNLQVSLSLCECVRLSHFLALSRS